MVDPATKRLISMNSNIIDNGDFVDVTIVAEITCSKTIRYGRDTSVAFVLRNIVKLRAVDNKLVCRLSI